MYIHNNRVVFDICLLLFLILVDENGRVCIKTILNVFYKLFKIPAKPLRLGVPYRTCWNGQYEMQMYARDGFLGARQFTPLKWWSEL